MYYESRQCSVIIINKDTRPTAGSVYYFYNNVNNKIRATSMSGLSFFLFIV